MKTLVFLLSTLISGFALSASATQISCVDAKTSAKWPVWVTYNLENKEFNMGYLELLGGDSKFAAPHQSVLATGEIGGDLQVAIVTGVIPSMRLEIRPTSALGRYKGLVSGPVYTPDNSIGDVKDYPVLCTYL